MAVSDRTVQLSPSLWVHGPRSVPGSTRLASSKWLTYAWMARQLAKWTSNRTCVLWLCSPRGLPLVELLCPDRVVYDMATLSATPRGVKVHDEEERQEIETLAQLERSLLAESHLTICSSEPLVEWVGRRARRVQLIPNGCDRPRYAAPPSPASDNLRAGYFGPLGPHVDVELVASIAKARPEWAIELTGTMPIEAMPAKLASFDVCLLPYREIDFTYYSSPMPAFEYLAAGKPIVSTPIGQIEGWNGLVSVAHGTQGFIAAIEHARTTVSAEHVTQRRVWAARNTWDVRVAQVAEALDGIGVTILDRSNQRATPLEGADRADRVAPPSGRLCNPLETTFAHCR